MIATHQMMSTPALLYIPVVHIQEENEKRQPKEEAEDQMKLLG
jgi:hypothetical protein